MLKKLYDILSPQGKALLPWLFGLFILGGVIELLSIISILPFMALASRPERALAHPFLLTIYQLGGFTSSQQFVIFSGIVTILALALGNGSALLTTYLGLRFMAGEHTRMATRLLERYFSREYEWFASQNSSDLSFRILGEVPNVVNGVMLSALRAAAKIVVIGLIVVSLLWVEPIIAISSATALIALQISIYGLIKPILSKTGRRRLHADHRRNRVVRESLTGIKSVILYGKSRFFRDLFLEYTATSAQCTSNLSAISESPRNILETIAFGLVVAILMLLIHNHVSVGDFLPTMSLFVVAVYRLLPAIQQVFSYATTMRMHAPSLDNVHRDLCAKPTPKPAVCESVPAFPFVSSLGLDRVTFSYAGNQAPVLRDVSVHIQRDSTVGLVGKTGCGKSTLLDLLLGLLQPDNGSLVVNGQTLTNEDHLAWRKNVGYVPQEILLLDDSIAANIAFGESPLRIDHGALERAAKIANIFEFIQALPGQFDHQVGDRGLRLSGGQRQRIGLARALYNDPPILILDEATSALDNVTEASVMAAIRELAGQKTIIIVAHRLTTVQECDRILVIDNGVIEGDGTYEELLRDCRAFQDLAAGCIDSLTEVSSPSNGLTQ